MIPNPTKRHGDVWPYAWQTMEESSPQLRNIRAKDSSDRSLLMARTVMKEALNKGAAPDDFMDPGEQHPTTYASAVIQGFAEASWYKQGRPTYLVSTDCYDALLRTNVDDIEIQDFRPPFDVIEVRLPEQRFERVPVALVVGSTFVESTLQHMGQVIQEQFRGNEISNTNIKVFQLLLQTKEQLNDTRDGIANPHTRGYMWTPGMNPKVKHGNADLEMEGASYADEDKRFLHIALTVCLLATHAHDELFSPLLLSRDQHIDPSEGAKYLDAVSRAQRRTRRKVWLIGKHMKSPTSRQDSAADSD